MRMQMMVPLDGSAFSEQPLTEAMELARRSNAIVHLVRVRNLPQPTTSPDAPVFYSADIAAEERLAHHEYLVGISKDRRTRGVEMRTAILDGAIADSLAAYAESNDIDIIMMSTHGRGGISRAWLGSVADRLIRTTHIPVLLFRSGPVRGHAWEMQPHILIPLDGSDVAEAIIKPATTFGGLINARYTLFQVIDPPIDASAEVLAQTRIASDAMRARAQDYLDQWATRLRAAGHKVDTRVAGRTHCASGIVEQAQNTGCDMIAMATHGRSGWQRVILGSVTDKVMRTSSASVLTVNAGM